MIGISETEFKTVASGMEKLSKVNKFGSTLVYLQRNYDLCLWKLQALTFEKIIRTLGLETMGGGGEPAGGVGTFYSGSYLYN